jgi:hypothetical protein
MTEEEFYKEFDNEGTKWEGDNCYKGLLIIAKYTDNLIHGASHDKVWSESIEVLIQNGITIEDTRELRLLNWSVEDDALFCFV